MRKSQKKTALVKGTLVLLAGLAVLLCVDTYDFWRGFARYSALAKKSARLLKVPVIPSEAIVVLTGEKRRIPQALDLLRVRKSPRLIISGAWRGTKLTALINSQGNSSENVQEIWKKIELESASTSTIENARESSVIFAREKITRVILVTSEFHMLRSLALFQLMAPKVEYLVFPIASEVSDLFEGKAESYFEPVAKAFVEFWKYFLFKHYFIHQLEPLQN